MEKPNGKIHGTKHPFRRIGLEVPILRCQQQRQGARFLDPILTRRRSAFEAVKRASQRGRLCPVQFGELSFWYS